MQFNSIEFALFFPIVTLLYFSFPHRYKNIFLLCTSVFFYMVYNPIYVLLLLAIAVLDFIAGRLIEQTWGIRRKLYLAISIGANILVLGIFKYAHFIFDSISILIPQRANFASLKILLPLGLSFHTFQAMAYVIEVYKRKVRAEKNLLIYTLYVLFYPQLVSGPIERPNHLLPQFKKTILLTRWR